MRPLSASDDFFDVRGPAKRLLRIDEVCALVGISRAMVYKCMKQGPSPFPKPVKIGALSRWLEEDVVAWIAQLRDELLTGRPNDQINM